MKKILICINLLLIIGQYAIAQRENSRWYMGYSTGMDFMNLNNMTGTVNGVANQTIPLVPAPLKGPISTAEGCFSISDKDGNFMFASDGITVYNGPLSTNIMENGTGLTGHPSSTQSGVIIPRPGHKDRYYIIASDYQGGTKGITYSEVDWSVTNANGRGTILNKNTPLNFGGIYPMTTSYEGVAAYPHANGKDYWVVNRTGMYFFVWLVTENGIDPSPVAKYSVGYNPGGTSSANAIGLGFVKFSMDGKYIAQTCWNGNVHSDIFIAKFDNRTGIIDVSSIATRRLPLYGAGWLFGIEFSPNNKYLYFTTLFHYNVHGDLWRIPITEPLTVNWELVQDKSIVIGNIGIGPDNKLYCVGGSANQPPSGGYTGVSRHLLIIPNPDDVTLDKYLIPNYFLAGTGQLYSLPNFVYSFFGAELKGDKVTCVNHNASYSVQISAGTGPNAVTKFTWNFGDGSPLVTEDNLNQLSYSQTHKYSQTGRYKISVTPYKADGTIVTDKIQTLEVRVSACMIPINPNIHTFNN